MKGRGNGITLSAHTVLVESIVSDVVTAGGLLNKFEM
jgi:hypothetical protein